MNHETSTRRMSMLPVFIVLFIFLAITAVFIYEFVVTSNDDTGTGDDALTADTYLDVVNDLLTDADVVVGSELVEAKGCNACHAGPNAGRLAPSHSEVAAFASQRRPPLTAEAYIYESIVSPGAYVVEGYQNNMPRVYAGQLTSDELGDIIAYLLLDGSDGE